MRAAVENRLHQFGDLRRVELEVRVLDGDDRAGGAAKADPNRTALAAVLLRVNDAELGTRHDLVEDLARAVGRSVVDDQDLARRRQIDRHAAARSTSATVRASLKTGTTIEMEWGHDAVSTTAAGVVRSIFRTGTPT